jgi:hypothetical protein
MPRQLNTEPVNFLPVDHPALRVNLPSQVEPTQPTVPFYRADGLRVDPIIEGAWQPPEPPKAGGPACAKRYQTRTSAITPGRASLSFSKI